MKQLMEFTPLHKLCHSIVDCPHSTPTWTKYGVIVLRNQNIRNGQLDLSAPSYTNEEDYRSRIRRAEPTHGDLVITREAPMGEVCMIPKGLRCCLGQRMVLLRPDPQIVNSKYLLYALQSASVQESIRVQGGTGSTVSNLRIPVLSALPIAMPSRLDEQRQIAEALTDVDELLAALDRLIAKKRAVKTAVMQELLTGRRRLQGFTGRWDQINMAKHAILKARIGWQGLTTEEYLDSGTYALVTGTDFVNGRIDWSSCHYIDQWRYEQDRNIQVRSGDVLLTKDGTIGKVGYVDNLPVPATLNSGIFVIRPIQDVFSPLYLYYVLTSRIFEEFLAKLSAGSTISHLYQKDFVHFEFESPPLEEQVAIGTLLNDIDMELAALEARRDKSQDVKQGMMQELLTGRTRLS